MECSRVPSWQAGPISSVYQCEHENFEITRGTTFWTPFNGNYEDSCPLHVNKINVCNINESARVLFFKFVCRYIKLQIVLTILTFPLFKKISFFIIFSNAFIKKKPSSKNGRKLLDTFWDGRAKSEKTPFMKVI